MQSALDASARVLNLFESPQLERTLSLHPPATVYSIAIDSSDLAVATALQCEPSGTFDAAAGAVPADTPRCSNLTVNNPVPGDGLLADYMTELPGLEEAGADVVTVRVTALPPPVVAALAPQGVSPHAAALQLGAPTPDDSAPTCAGAVPLGGGQAQGGPVGMRAMLCDLVARASSGGAAAAPAPGGVSLAIPAAQSAAARRAPVSSVLVGVSAVIALALSGL